MSATTLDLYMRREECSIMLSVGSVYNFQVCLPVVFEAMTHPKIPQQTPHWRHWFNAIQNASQNASKYSKHCHCMPLGAAPVWRCVVPQRGSGHDHDCVPGRWFETFIWFMKKNTFRGQQWVKICRSIKCFAKERLQTWWESDLKRT